MAALFLSLYFIPFARLTRRSLIMSRLTTVATERLNATTLAELDPFKMKGEIADVYLQIGNSEPGLLAYLSMENALKASELSLREIEAIKLLVSEINCCDYCLSVHNFKASAAGFSDNEKIAIRRAEPIGDSRVDLVVALVARFFKEPGAVSETDLQALRDAGFSDGDLVDITIAISAIFFTNIFNHVNGTAPTLPVPSPVA